MFISNWIRERKIRKIAEQVMLSQLHEYRNASAYHRESMVESWLKSYGPGHNAYQCMAKQSLETAKQVLKALDEEKKKGLPYNNNLQNEKSCHENTVK